MKTLGLLGGTAWISTIEYYRKLNQKVHKRLGKQHSANLVLRSIDYEEIKQYNYQNWGEITDILFRELRVLESCNVDAIMICNNTLHKALEMKKIHLKVPIIHIVENVGNFAKNRGYTNALLIGTKFTMEDGFYENILKKYGLSIMIPNEEERNEIQRITQEELGQGITKDSSISYIKNIVNNYNPEAVIIGCTELPMIVRQEDYDIPILDTLELHCDAGVDFLLL